MKPSNASNTKIDIILVTWGREYITKLCIDSITRNTKRSNYRLIVIDNCSPQSMVNMLIQLYTDKKIDELVLNNKNYGLEYARNQGLKLAKNHQYIICADNDCLAPPKNGKRDWIDELRDLMMKYDEYAAISARTQVMIGTGNIFEHADEDGSDIVEFAHPGGSYRIMYKPAVEKVGGWRDEEPGRGSEERYICGKLHELGYKTAFAVNVKTLHLFGDKQSDRWGYPKDWKPEDTGHSDIWHPVLEAGDDPEEIKKYLGGDYVRRNS